MAPDYIIPLHRPYIGEDEFQAIKTAYFNRQLVGNGTITKEFNKKLADYLNVKYAFFVNSGTSALEIANLVLGQNKRVLIPDFTFTSVGNSVIRTNNIPIFSDIEKQNFNINPNVLNEIFAADIDRIIAVHYAGMPSDFELLNKLKQENEIQIIEDAAHAIGSKWDNRHLGTIADIGCYSFHSTKNLVTGEGGAIVTDDDELAQKIEIVIEKGTNRSAFFRGEVDKYQWVGTGGSYVQSDLLAALGIKQLEKIDQMNNQRKKIAERYLNEFKHLYDQEKLTLPNIPQKTDPNWHIFSILAPDPKKQHRAIRKYKENGIGATFHYQPLSTSKFGQKFETLDGNPCKNSIEVANRIIRLPIYAGLTEEQVDKIIAVTNEIFGN